jgi:hypothetical protein
MLIEIKQVQTEYTRLSKNGKEHSYFRNRSTAVLQCDSCFTTFERPVREMDSKRLGAGYTHVCPNCNPKQFAQSKGVEGRRFWNTTVDLDVDIDKI